MEIQVRGDGSLPTTPELLSAAETEVVAVLGAFERRLTSIDVHLSGEPAGSRGGPTVRCLVEVRPAGLEPLVVTQQSPTADEAVRGAARRMRELLVSTFGRLDRRHPGAESIRTRQRGQGAQRQG